MIALASIIDRFGQAFLAQHGASALPSQRQALNAMKHCRSILGPGLLAQCGDCGEPCCGETSSTETALGTLGEL
jgi:hypothetical protein